MNFYNLNQLKSKDDLFLRPVSIDDKNLVYNLFIDEQFKKYYIVPDEIRQESQKFIEYWINAMKAETGFCWVIIKKEQGIFTLENQVGFITFEFKETIKDARVSYAISPNYRYQGIATNSLKILIDILKQEGVEKIEAEIDTDNFNSINVVEKLGFVVRNEQASIDREIMSNGIIRTRLLWQKVLIETNSACVSGRIPIDANLIQIIPIINSVKNEINLRGQNPKLLMRYFYLLGRIKFIEQNYEECKNAFVNCNMIAMNEGLPDIHETFFWFAKIHEIDGNKENAIIYYEFALEKYNMNPDYISKEEIEIEMLKNTI